MGESARDAGRQLGAHERTAVENVVAEARALELTRGLLNRWRGRLMRTGSTGKYILGGLLIFVAILILTGWDRVFEGFVVEHSPDWLTDFTTSV